MHRFQQVHKHIPGDIFCYYFIAHPEARKSVDFGIISVMDYGDRLWVKRI
jgi:hypothetical protein